MACSASTPCVCGTEGGTAHEDLARVVRWLCEEARDKCGITMEASDWQTHDLGEGAPQHPMTGE